MRKILALVPLLLVGTLVAQSFVAPPGFATKEGNSYLWAIGQYDYCRCQQLFPKASMPARTPYFISSFKLRRDGLRTTAFEKHTTKIKVFMSNLKYDPPAQLSYAWEGNHGADKAKVMSERDITWGADPLPAKAPAPFTVNFPLNKPFAYTGGGFCIDLISDFKATTPTKYNYNWVTDAENDASWAGGYVAGTRVNIGTSCRPKGATSDPANFGYYPFPGQIFWKYCYTRVNQSGIPGLIFVGSSHKTWGAIPLPLDLAFMGATGCKVYVDMVMAFVATSDAGGRIDFKMGTIPTDPFLEGQKYHIQMFAFDKAFNNAGMISTYGREYTIGSGFKGKTAGFCCYSYKSSATSTYTHGNEWWDFYKARANIVQFN